MDCDKDFVIWVSAWSDEKKAWCCEHVSRGCVKSASAEAARSANSSAPRATNASASNVTKPLRLGVNVSVSESIHGGANRSNRTASVVHAAVKHTTKKTTTTKRTTTTKVTSSSSSTRTSTTTPTTTVTRTTSTHTTSSATSTTESCNRACTYGGSSGTCADAIRQSSMLDFLGNPDSCELAQQAVAAECSICAGCPAASVGCGIIEPPTSTLPPPSAHPCQEMCEVGDQVASCEARILWVADNLLKTSDKACTEARKMIVSQCPICERCPLEQTTCTRGVVPEEEEHDYDCSGNSAQWSPQQRASCCKSNGRGCIFLDDAPSGFKKKFDAGVAVVADSLTSVGRRGLAVAAASAIAAAAAAVALMAVVRRGRAGRPLRLVPFPLCRRSSYNEVPLQAGLTDASEADACEA